MGTPAIYLGLGALRPALVADDKGNAVLVRGAASVEDAEGLARAAVATMGSSAAYVPAPLSGADVKRVAIRNAYSQVWRLGRTVLAARAAGADPVAAAAVAENGRVLFAGKVDDVARETKNGFVSGSVTLTEVAKGDDPPACVLHFKNIFTACELDGAVLVAVPDLISVLESDTGRAVGVEELKYGMRASVVAIPCASQLRTARALAVVGPAAFGLGVAFEVGGVGEYREPASAFADDAAKL